MYASDITSPLTSDFIELVVCIEVARCDCLLNGILQVMNLIGDVKGKVAVMVDDMIDTAGELCSKSKLLHCSIENA